MNKRDRDRLIDLASEVAKLRAELQEKESEFDRILGRGSELNGVSGDRERGPQNGERPTNGERSVSLVSRIVQVLESSERPDMTPDELRIELGEVEERAQTIRSTLSRLAGEGRITSTSHGHYAA